MRTLFAIAAVAATPVVVAPAVVHADQLMCNEEAVAQRAAQMLPEGAVIIDFCSMCEDRVRVVRIKSAAAVQDCNWTLEVAGRIVWESVRPFEGGYDPEKARFRPDESRYLRRLDLAYVYVEVAPNDFRWLGGQLGLQAQVATPTITLPKDVSASLGTHPLVVSPAPSGPPKAEAPADGPASQPEPASPAEPDRLAAAQVFDYWRSGTGGPVLAHFVACLKVDLKKGSATRYECVKPVEGPVTPGTQVFGWADWLVPRGQKFDDVALAFVYDGKVRLERKLPVRGRKTTPIVPTTLRAKLSRQGTYTLRLTRGEKTLAEVDVEVR